MISFQLDIKRDDFNSRDEFNFFKRLMNNREFKDHCISSAVLETERLFKLNPDMFKQRELIKDEIYAKLKRLSESN